MIRSRTKHFNHVGRVYSDTSLCIKIFDCVMKRFIFFFFPGFENLFKDQLPNRLQEAQVPLLSRKDCQNNAYGSSITKYMQCAGYLEGAHLPDTCKGDSGGPLMCQDKRGIFKLWGITSWGNNYFCSSQQNAPAPGVYTKVDKYLKWINKKLSTRKCT